MAKRYCQTKWSAKHGKTKKPINVPASEVSYEMESETTLIPMHCIIRRHKKRPPRCQGPQDMLLPLSRKEVGWKLISKTQQEIQLFSCIFSYHLACKVNHPNTPISEIQVEHQHPLLLMQPQKQIMNCETVTT